VTQAARGSSLWKEPANGGGTPAALGMLLRKSGSDWIWDTTGPEEGKFIDVDGLGDYTLIDLTPVYIVADGSDYTISTTGPAVAILVASGSDLTLSTDLLAAPAADLFYDSGGDLVLVLRSCDRLDAVLVGGTAITF
jgi:hypothetical protein